MSSIDQNGSIPNDSLECIRSKMEFKFDQTYSRQMLSEYAEKVRKSEEAARQARMRHAVEHCVNLQIANGVLEAAKTCVTFYLFELSNNRRPDGFTDDDLIRGLREKFPECTVTLAEEWVEQPTRNGHPPTRVLKSGIKIDWS